MNDDESESGELRAVIAALRKVKEIHAKIRRIRKTARERLKKEDLAKYDNLIAEAIAEEEKMKEQLAKDHDDAAAKHLKKSREKRKEAEDYLDAHMDSEAKNDLENARKELKEAREQLDKAEHEYLEKD